MALVLDKHLILCCRAFSTTFVVNATTINRTFQVLMTIQKACTVTAGSASNITPGPVSITATGTSTGNTVSINCSETTPYFIGLAPSAANGRTTVGSGAMSSVANAATNTDKVPYQLDRTSATGLVWGNIATNTAPGSGVAAVGTSLARTYTVYVTAPSASFTSDDYADTITVNVNY